MFLPGDYEASEVQVEREVEGEEHQEPVAPVLSPVASDRKLSSAVLVLENCLLQSQSRNSLASPSTVDEVQQPTRPGRKRKQLGIRKGVARKALTGEGHGAALQGSSEEIVTPKQRVIKRQKREV